MHVFDRLGAVGDLQLAVERGRIDDDLLVVAQYAR